MLLSLFNLTHIHQKNLSKESAFDNSSMFSALHIIQFGDANTARTMQYYRRSIQNLASCHQSYEYSLIIDDGNGRADGMCLYTSKVAVIRRALLEYDVGDWILWLDLDV